MEGQFVSHYRLVRKLGAGAFGEVWEGVHRDIEAIRVAVKLLHPALSGDQSFVENLKRECVTLHTLQHANVVGFRELVLSGDRPAMVMEMVEGEDAFEAVQKGAMKPERVLEIGRDALTGLAFAHEAGVVHRDVKPSNLFLCGNGKTKLLDFGIAKAADGTNATKTGTIQGTLQYVAPEQFSGSNADAGSDLYALGLSLYELLTGRPACPVGAMPEQFAWHLTKGLESLGSAGVPEPLWAVLLKLSAREPKDRFPSASDALDGWNAVVLSSPPAGEVSPTPPGTVTLELSGAGKGVDSPSAPSLPPQSVVLPASEVEKRVDERPSAPSLPPQSVVLSASEVEGELRPQSVPRTIEPAPDAAGPSDLKGDSGQPGQNSGLELTAGKPKIDEAQPGRAQPSGENSPIRKKVVVLAGIIGVVFTGFFLAAPFKTELSEKAGALSEGATFAEVLKALGDPDYAFIDDEKPHNSSAYCTKVIVSNNYKGDNKEYQGLGACTVTLLWSNGSCPPVEISFEFNYPPWKHSAYAVPYIGVTAIDDGWAMGSAECNWFSEAYAPPVKMPPDFSCKPYEEINEFSRRSKNPVCEIVTNNNDERDLGVFYPKIGVPGDGWED